MGARNGNNKIPTNESGGYRDTVLLHKAIRFAALAHKEQKRKGTEIPYIVHPFEAAQILSIAGCDNEVIIAGLLHDTVEDTPTTIDDIEEEFGSRVARFVLSCTEDKTKSWKERKNHTISHLAEEKDNDILKLACSDKLSNLRSMNSDYSEYGDDLWNRFNNGKIEQNWYFSGLIEALGNLEETDMYEELKYLYEIVFATN